VVAGDHCVYFKNCRKINWEFEEVMNSTSIQLDQFKKITVRVQSV